MVTFVYFSFTTISTVGFGDYYPVNSFERLCMCSVVLVLVAAQSFVMSLILSAMDIFISLDKEFDDSGRLDAFFALIYTYNGSKEMDK